MKRGISRFMTHSFFQTTTGKRWVSAILCCVMAFSLFACSFSSSGLLEEDGGENPETIAAFDEFLDQFFYNEVTSNTINLHFTLSDPESFGITDYEITLGDLSEEAYDESYASIENYLQTLKGFNYSSLSTNQQLTYDILLDSLELQLDMADLYLYEEPLSPSTGVQSQLPILYEEYTFYDEDDITDYLQLIALTDEYFEQVITFEQKKADAGLFMSDFSCDKVISQCEDFVAAGENHYLIETFNNRIDEMTDLSQEQKDSYKIENEQIVLEHILPAYDNLASSLTNLLGSGKNDQGLCYLPDGKTYYEYLVYYNTGCSDSIKDIQTMVANERAALLSECADLTNEDPTLWDQCADVTLNNVDSTTTLNNLQTAMLKDFPAAPDVNFTVNYIDECGEDYLAPAYYITSPIDNYTSNSIYINANTDTADISYFTTLAHEGYPGHLYQTVMSYEAGLNPARCMLNFSGYVEGWATYVEMQSYYYAGLDENVAALLQKNQSAILSLYASTDLGIHYDGWSLEDTIQFWNSYGITDEDAIQDIYEYIIGEPSSYLKYYVGYLQFKELQEATKLKYLYNYDNINFHRAVLKIGPAPFDIVEKYLDEYY